MTANPPDVVVQPAPAGGDVVGEGAVRDPLAVAALLAQLVQHRDRLVAPLVGVHPDVVAVGVGREEADDAGGAQPALLDHRVEHRLRVVPEPAGRLAGGGLLRMSGKRPFISQELKNGCQSMYSRRSPSG